MNLRISAIALTALAAAFSSAQYVVRGEFNNWGGNGDLVMADMGGGVFEATATGLTPGQSTLFKCTTTDWSFNGPGSDAKTVANADGKITFRFMPNQSWADGWLPSNKVRVGYADPGQFGWEVVGDMNNWGNDGSIALTNMGNGLYKGSAALAAGSYNFKFRKAGDWGISVGEDFGNSAGNLSVTAASPITEFYLDLPNGRMKTEAVPEPATMATLALGAMALIRRRKA